MAVSKLKHTKLWEAAKRAGSQSALAKALGVPPATLGRWINLEGCPRKYTPYGHSITDSEEYRELDAKCLIHVGKGLEELFPDALREAEDFLKGNKTIEKTASVHVAALLTYATHTTDRLTYDPSETDRPAELAELRGGLQDALTKLSYREREIIKLRYGLDDGYCYTLEEVGYIFKVSRGRIEQIEAKAIRKLREPSQSQGLVGFLD